MLGRRPTAINRWLPVIGAAPVRGVNSNPLSRLAIRMSAASTTMSMPSPSRISRMVVGDVVVFAGRQSLALFDHGDACAEAAVHLSEFQRDVTAADDDEMVGHRVEFEDRHVGQVVDVGQSGDVRHDRAAADVEEDPVGLQACRRRPAACAGRRTARGRETPCSRPCRPASPRRRCGRRARCRPCAP